MCVRLSTEDEVRDAVDALPPEERDAGCVVVRVVRSEDVAALCGCDRR